VVHEGGFRLKRHYMRSADLARAIQCELRGNPDLDITSVAPLGSARAGDVTFLGDAARVDDATLSPGSVIIVNQELAGIDALSKFTLLVSGNPKLAFARAIDLFHREDRNPRGVSPELVIGASSSYGADCSIHPRVTIGSESHIGDRVTLHPGVVIGDRVFIDDDTTVFGNVAIYDDTAIGKRCRIHSGTVIGSDGFSFVADEDGHQFKLWQIGRVVIEDDVEIGANCCIDRGGFGETRIRRGVKFDNLIQVGHNCDVGEDTVVAALAGFSGGTRVGRSCIIAGQIGTNQHITVGDRAIITARTGVTKSVEPGRLMGGMMPAMDYQKWRRAHALYARLPELFERLKKLERMPAVSGDRKQETPE
jgi:UDP-3-O-[3-hydroxymyristoyl] glucosamine N-acyltransferase